MVDITEGVSGVPNKEYKYLGKIMVVDENGKVEQLKDKDGKAVEKTVDVKADENGNINANVDFGNIDTTELKGKKLVAYEYLMTTDGTVIAKEENPENKDQTIQVTNPKLKTTALINGHTGTASPDKNSEVSDLVEVTDFTTNTPLSLSAIASDSNGKLMTYKDTDGKTYAIMGKVNVDWNNLGDVEATAELTDKENGIYKGSVKVPLQKVETKGDATKISDIDASKRVELNTSDTNKGGSFINTNAFAGQSVTLYEDLSVTDKDNKESTVVASHPTSDDKEGKESQTIKISKPEMHTTALIDLNTGKEVDTSNTKGTASSSDSKDETTSSSTKESTASSTDSKSSDSKLTSFKSDEDIQKEYGGKKETNPTNKVRLADVVQYKGARAGDVIDATVMARDSKTGEPYIIKNDKGEDCVLVGRKTFTAEAESGTFTVPLKAVKLDKAKELLGGKSDKEIALNMVKNIPLTFGGLSNNTDSEGAQVKSTDSNATETTKDETASSTNASTAESTTTKSSTVASTEQSSGETTESTTATSSTESKDETTSSDENTADSESTEEIDASQLAGDTLTFFEVLSTPSERENPENVLVSETDKDNKSQQVKVNQPKIQTTQRVNGGKSILDSKTGKYVDTVKYENLTPGEQVTLKVVETKNGKPVVVNGKYLTGTKTFTPDKANGTVDVEMKLTDQKPADELINKVIDEKTGKIAPSFDYVTPNGNKSGTATDGETSSTESSNEKSTDSSATTDESATTESTTSASEENGVSPAAYLDDASSSTEESSSTTEGSKDESKFDSETTKAENVKLEKGEYVAFETMYGDTDENGTPTVIAEHKDANDKGQTVTVKETPKSSKTTESTPETGDTQATTSQPTTLAKTGSGSKVTENKLFNLVYGFFH